MDPDTLILCGVVVAGVAALAISIRVGLWKVPVSTEGAGDSMPLLLSAVLVYLVAQLAAAVTISALAPGAAVPTSDAAGLPARAIGLVISGCVSFGLGYFVWRRLAVPPGPSGKGSTVSNAAIGLAMAAAAAPMLLSVSMLSGAAHRLLTGETPDPLAHTLLQLVHQHRANPYTLLILVSAGVLAPMAEEVVYRGLIQTGLSRVLTRTGGRPTLGVLVTAVLFAAVHIPVVPVQALPTLLVLALILGLARARTGGLAAPILIHMLFNIANLTAVWFAAPTP